MKANFILSEKLRLFLSLGSSHKFLSLGMKFPVSIRKRYSFSQTMMIYQESGFDFFTMRELHYFMSLADSLGLSFYVTVENGVPVIEISDYTINAE